MDSGSAKGRLACKGSRYQHSRLGRRSQPAFISPKLRLVSSGAETDLAYGIPRNCRPHFGSYAFGMNQDLPKFRDLPYDCSCGGEGMAPVSRVPGIGAIPELITYQCPACGHVETLERPNGSGYAD